MSELFTAKKVLSSLLTDKKEDTETVLKNSEKTTETKDLEKIDGKLKSREDVSLTDVVERDNKKMINVLRRGFKLDEFSHLDETAKLAEKQEKASGGITSAIKALGTLIFGGPMAKDIAKLVSKIGDIGKLIERIPGVGRIARAAPRLLRTAGSLLGKLALPLQAGLSALDARRGYDDVEGAKKNFDSENWYGRGMNAAKSVIDGLTFGLIPEEKVTRGLRTFMGDVDKDGNPNKDKWTPEQKAQWEQWVKEHEEKSGKDRTNMPPPPPPSTMTAQRAEGTKDQSLPQDATSHIFQSQSGPGKYRAGSLPRDVEQEIEANARKYNLLSL